jgi:hypothetical protein
MEKRGVVARNAARKDSSRRAALVIGLLAVLAALFAAGF